jgi:dolichyl-diphosphooligosaccharide--protein glycosyltransferase
MTKKSSSGSDTTELLLKLVWLGAIIYGIGFFLYYAYEIRLQAIKEFGPVIHEFDPYFNWRATQVRLCHDFLTAK